MVQVDLITGFLGAGKTTFIRQYVRYLLAEGKRVGIIENDYGAVNVDRMLLQDVLGDNCEIETVAGGCDYDCHLRRFRTKLIAMAMCGYDHVLVEPSGIFDVDEFFDVLRDEPLDRWYRIGSVLSIVNAKLEGELSAEAEYLLTSQTADAGILLFSRSQEATAEEVRQTLGRVNAILKKSGCKRQIQPEESLAKDWNELTRADFERITTSGYRQESFEKRQVMQQNGYQSLYFMNLAMTKEELAERTAAILADDSCGHVLRIKGFQRTGEGWLEVNTTKEELSLKPIFEGQEILLVIGEKLNESRISAHWQS